MGLIWLSDHIRLRPISWSILLRFISRYTRVASRIKPASELSGSLVILRPGFDPPFFEFMIASNALHSTHIHSATARIIHLASSPQ